MEKNKLLPMVFLFVFAWAGTAWGHVPYFETEDFSPTNRFVIPYKIEQSIAAYAWLTTDGILPSTDVDVYEFTIEEPTGVYLEVIVPACRGYESLAPWFALVGQGLPAPTEELPFELPPGWGALVTPHLLGEEPRPKFWEPFGGKFYYEGPQFKQVIEQPGTYYIVYWDPAQIGGDYVAVIGDKEIWRLPDIMLALVNTPKIRQDMELHLECLPPLADDDDATDDDSADDDAADDDAADDDAADDDAGDDDESMTDDDALDDDDDDGCGS